MRISIAEAEGQLTELVRLANQGEEVVLTQDGLPSVRLEPVPHAGGLSEKEAIMSELRRPLTLATEKKPLSSAEKAKIIEEIRNMARERDLPPGPDAARSQDFLYDEFGLPK